MLAFLGELAAAGLFGVPKSEKKKKAWRHQPTKHRAQGEVESMAIRMGPAPSRIEKEYRHKARFARSDVSRDVSQVAVERCIGWRHLSRLFLFRSIDVL
jgi:hypothetical protein